MWFLSLITKNKKQTNKTNLKNKNKKKTKQTNKKTACSEFVQYFLPSFAYEILLPWFKNAYVGTVHLVFQKQLAAPQDHHLDHS